jgi:hypothetical protein
MIPFVDRDSLVACHPPSRDDHGLCSCRCLTLSLAHASGALSSASLPLSAFARCLPNQRLSASFTCTPVRADQLASRGRELITSIGHSRWHRLQAIAAAANVAFEPVQNFSVMKAMNDPGTAKAPYWRARPCSRVTTEFLSKFPGGTVPAFESMDGKVCLTECSAIADYSQSSFHYCREKILCLMTVACTNPESELIPTDAGEAAQVRNWLLICEAEVIAQLFSCM